MDDLFSIKPVKQNPRQAKNLQAARQVPQPIFNRGDFEYTLQKAFAPTAPARVPPTPPSLPISKRHNRGAAAAPAAPIAPTAPAPPPPVTILSSFQLKSQDGTVTFNVRPGQNPALNAPDKRSKGEVPKDWTCTACGFESTSYDGARVHRQRCGKKENVICPVCQKSISKSNTTHLKMCPSLKKKN